MFRSLDAARIAETAERLGKRITERFPGSGLSGVAPQAWVGNYRVFNAPTPTGFDAFTPTCTSGVWPSCPATSTPGSSEARPPTIETRRSTDELTVADGQDEPTLASLCSRS